MECTSVDAPVDATVHPWSGISQANSKLNLDKPQKSAKFIFDFDDVPDPAQPSSGSGGAAGQAPDASQAPDATEQEAVRAKPVPAPYQPTRQEIEEHNLTHLPCRSWCRHCCCCALCGRQRQKPCSCPARC